MPSRQTTLRVLNILSYGVMAAMLGIILYWIATNSFEDIETIILAVIITLLLAGNLWLARRGHTRLATWLVVGLLLLLNGANILWYGIGSTSTAALLIPITAAVIGLGTRDGVIVTAISLLIVWGTVLASAFWGMPTAIPYQISQLTFDAPMLTVLFTLVTAISAQAQK